MAIESLTPQQSISVMLVHLNRIFPTDMGLLLKHIEDHCPRLMANYNIEGISNRTKRTGELYTILTQAIMWCLEQEEHKKAFALDRNLPLPDIDSVLPHIKLGLAHLEQLEAPRVAAGIEFETHTVAALRARREADARNNHRRL